MSVMKGLHYATNCAITTMAHMYVAVEKVLSWKGMNISALVSLAQCFQVNCRTLNYNTATTAQW